MHPRRHRHAFTLVELLVVVSIIALLVGILIATLGGASEQAKATACASRLKGIGTALQSYLNDHDTRLPQVWLLGSPPSSPAQVVQPTQGQSAMIGALFAGTFGDLPFYGIDEVGPARRPLNSYLGVTNTPEEPADPNAPAAHAEEKFQVEAVLDPSDAGLTDPETESLLGPDDGDAMDQRYELLGTSYVLNEFVLSDDPTPGAPEVSTLIPTGFTTDGRQVDDGRMPRIADPGRTVLAGDGPMHNYNRRKNLAQHWHFGRQSRAASRRLDPLVEPKGYVEATMLFTDLHVTPRVRVKEPFYGDPDRVLKMNSTPDYTFLPNPDWPLAPVAP